MTLDVGSARLMRMEPGYDEETDTYVTGAGQVIVNLHPRSEDCDKFGCTVHNPTEHNMRGFPTLWRQDRGLMERTCPHGVGHPDPDHMAWYARKYGEDKARWESIHGCDGCCWSDTGTDEGSSATDSAGPPGT